MFTFLEVYSESKLHFGWGGERGNSDFRILKKKLITAVIYNLPSNWQF